MCSNDLGPRLWGQREDRSIPVGAAIICCAVECAINVGQGRHWSPSVVGSVAKAVHNILFALRRYAVDGPAAVLAALRTAALRRAVEGAVYGDQATVRAQPIVTVKAVEYLL